MFTDQELGFLRDYANRYGLKAPDRLGDAHLGGYRDRKHDPDGTPATGLTAGRRLADALRFDPVSRRFRKSRYESRNIDLCHRFSALIDHRGAG